MHLKLPALYLFEEGLAKAEQIDWFVIIKASEGGGGKGIRKVDSPEGFKNVFHDVAGLVQGKFF